MKNKAIIFLRNSLLLFVFISAMGPLSSTSLSKRLQVIRLENLLKTPKESMEESTLKEIYEILSYLNYNHSIIDTGLTKEELSPEELMNKMSLDYNPYESTENSIWYNFQGIVKAYDIKDYDFIIPKLNKKVIVNNISFEVSTENEIKISKENLTKSIPFITIINGFLEKYPKTDENVIKGELEYSIYIPEFQCRIMFIFSDLNFSLEQNNKLSNLYSEFSLLIKFD